MSRFKVIVLALVGGGALVAYALFLRSTSSSEPEALPQVSAPSADPRFLAAARDKPEAPAPPLPPVYAPPPLRYEDLVPPPPPPPPVREMANPLEELERATALTALRGTASPTPSAEAAPAASSRLAPRSVAAGTLIEAQLHEPLRTDQPTTVAAQSLRPVYDAYNRTIVLPAGTRFLGTVSPAQAHDAGVELYWHRLITPDGRSLELGKPAAATDENGGSLDGRRRVYRGHKTAAILVTALTTAALEAARGDGTSVSLGATAGSEAVSGTEAVLSRWAQQALARPPTIRLEAGTTFYIRVLADITL